MSCNIVPDESNELAPEHDTLLTTSPSGVAGSSGEQTQTREDCGLLHLHHLSVDAINSWPPAP
jgi:hypothetical protein